MIIEYSAFNINEQGELIYEFYNGGIGYINGCKPTFDIKNEPELLDVFMEYINDKDFCNAITFTYK